MVPSSFPTSPNRNKLPVNVDSDSPRATLGFIGEAPGRYEIAKQQVFIGPSGQLLNAVLEDYGVDREEVFLGNATLCHYPDSMKELPPAAIEACRPRLMEELEGAGVTTVIPMGNSAVKAIFPKEISRKGITQLRQGRPKVLDHFSVVPTFHPAACLRSPAWVRAVWEDLQRARSLLDAA